MTARALYGDVLVRDVLSERPEDRRDGRWGRWGPARRKMWTAILGVRVGRNDCCTKHSLKDADSALAR